MPRPSLLRSVRNLFTTPNAARPRASALRAALRCEPLEDRAVPAAVSSFASAVSLASSVNASGTTDLVTISVRDTDGLPVSGLTTEDFTFSLTSPPQLISIPPRVPPGQVTILPFPFPFPMSPPVVTTPSTGTFGSVTEIGTSGTYFTQFTGITAGSSVNLTATVDGVTLTQRPTVRVTPGAVSASASTVSVASSGQSQAAVTISAVDAAGNAITGLPSSAFQFSLSGGTTTGTFGPATETETPGVYTTTLTGRVFVSLNSISGNTFGGLLLSQGGTLGSGLVVSSGSIRFPSQGGTPSILTVTIDDTQIDDQVTVRLTGGSQIEVLNLDPRQTNEGLDPLTPQAQLTPVMSLASPTAASGTTNLVTIVVRRTDGSPVPDLQSKDFTFSFLPSTTLQSSNQPSSTGAIGQVTETATPGVYTALFTGRVAGAPLTLSLDVGGIRSASLPTVRVTPGAVSATASAVSFAPAARGGVVALHAKDAVGNAVTGLPDTTFQLSLSGGTSTGTFSPMTERGTTGVYASTFTGTAVGTPSALTVAVGNSPLSSQPTVEVTEVEPPSEPVRPFVVTTSTPPAAPPAAVPVEPLYTGAFVVGNLLVVQGRGVPGGTAVLALPPGSAALFADADGDGRRDVVLLLPRLAVVLDAATGQVRAIPF